MQDCDRCPASRFCGYPNRDWFPMGVIRFCRPQIVFLVEHLDELRGGHYPKQPGETGYIDPGVRSQPRQSAPFEQPAQLAAEIDCRLATVPGIVRKLFTLQIQWDYELDEDTIPVLNYVSGWRRKKTAYRVWKAMGKMRKNVIKK